MSACVCVCVSMSACVCVVVCPLSPLPVVQLGGVHVQARPGLAALDAVFQVLLAGDHVTLEDPVQRDGSAAQPDDLITHLKTHTHTQSKHCARHTTLLDERVPRTQARTHTHTPFGFRREKVSCGID